MNSKSAIVKEFNATILELIKRLEKKSRDENEGANIDRMKQRMNSAKRELGPQILIEESSPYFMEYGPQILDRTKYEEMVLTMDVRAEFIKRNKTIKAENEFFFTLIDSIRNHYKNGTQNEKNEVYIDVLKLYKACPMYASCSI